jgi:glycosyltransferase involved in cell wall biosynthesis
MRLYGNELTHLTLTTRILFLSDPPSLATGYGVIAKNLSKQFRARGIEVGFVGLQLAGSPVYFEIGHIEEMKGSPFGPIYDGTTTMNIERAFKDFSPDIGIHVRDAFAHTPRYHTNPYSLKNLRGAPPIILNTPVQADMLPQAFVDACNNECFVCAPPTEWARDVLLFQGVPANHLEVGPWGYDPEIFHPMEVKKEDYGFDPKKLLIGGVGVGDQARKGWSLLLKAAGIVKRSLDIEVYLHTDPAAGSFDLPHFIDKFGLKGSVILPVRYSKTWGIKEELLAGLYNCMDAYVSPSAAEGWGLPGTEALGCGTPTVVTDHPNFREVLGEHAFYIPAKQAWPTAWTFEWLCDVDEMAKILAKALSMSKEERLAKANVQSAYAETTRSWSKAADKWVEFFTRHKEFKFTA